MYEPRNQKLLGPAAFIRRILLHVSVAFTVLALSLGAGMLGYHLLEGLSWLDSFLNSAMLLGGMGPVDLPVTKGGRFFAGMYALYAGLVFIVTAALVLTPLVHRMLHRFHLDSK